MTQDEIIEMAKQVGVEATGNEYWPFFIEELMDFAKLVAEKAIKEALAQPEQIPPSADSNTHQPERHELQAKGEHPAPCARHCEANAFQIVIKNLKAQLAQLEQEEKLPPVEIGVDVTDIGTTVVAFYRRPNAVMEMFYSQFHPLAQPEQEPVAIKRMKEWIEYLKRKSDFGQHMKIPSEMSAGNCWELAIELEQFINTFPPQRTWVWLTKVERIELLESTHPNNRWSLLALCEALLKEKNT